MGGAFFVKFVIAIVVVFKKPLLAPPSFSVKKMGGTFFFNLCLLATPLGFCRRYCYF
jgi:hypothetical protein